MGEGVVILSRHCPSSLQQPVINDSTTKALLLAMVTYYREDKLMQGEVVFAQIRTGGEVGGIP